MTCPDAIRRVAVPRPYRHVMGSQATSVSDRSVWRGCSMDSSRGGDEESEAGEIYGVCARCSGFSLRVFDVSDGGGTCRL
eukprot:7102907-Prymnesium_polylepis.1